MRRRFPTIVLTMLLISGATNAAEIRFFDGDFAPGDWSETISVFDDPTNPTPGPGAASAVLSQVTGGGNPGNFRGIIKVNRRGDIVTIFDINVNRYNFSSNGAIDKIRFDFDASSSGAFDVNTPFVPILQQNDTFYFSLAGVTSVDNDPVWQPIASGELTASDFDTNPLALFGLGAPTGMMPDFAASAAPLGFGYATLGSTAGSDPLIILNGIDNFSVTFTTVSVPEPNGIAILAVCGLVPCLRRDR